MGGFFGAVSANDCISDVFFGTDYHSHLGTRRGGMTAFSPALGFQRNIHSIENSYRPASFNSVITNPPYFSGGIKNYSVSKSISRHMDSIDSWIWIASRMLVPEGYFYTMNRPENLIDVVCSMRDNHLEPKTICFVKNSCNDEPFLFLISGRKNGRPSVRIQKDLILYENDVKTDEFNKLYNLET